MDWGMARDIVIVVYGVLVAIAALVTIIVMVAIYGVVRKIGQELSPTLESTKTTANTVSATVRFVSEMVVRPIASTAGAVVALGKLLQVILGGTSTRKGGK